MKQYLYTALALSLALPVHAMDDDMATLKKLSSLNKQAQKILCESVLIVADSSLEDAEKALFLRKEFGLYHTLLKDHNEIDEAIGESIFKRNELKKKIAEQQKFWFFNPHDCTLDEPDDEATLFAKVLAMKEQLEELIADE
jgi:hypothetical protein